MPRVFARLLPLAVAVLAACGGSDSSPSAPTDDPGTATPAAGSAAPVDEQVDGTVGAAVGGEIGVEDGAADGVDTPLPGLDRGPTLAELPAFVIQPFEGSLLSLETFPRDRIVSGGVARDGIPALTNPTFVAPGAIAYLEEDDLVLGVVIDGEARAYPHNIGWWHEIVNDRLGDRSISVTFCPLTGTGLVFDTTGEDGEQFQLGVSGLLYNNNLVLYDRRDRSTLYPQLYGTGVDGERRGESLTLLPVVETTWRAWKTLYPDTGVIESGTYSLSRYTRYPYGNYRTDDGYLIFGLRPTLANNFSPYSTSYGAKDMVLGLRLNGEAKAYPFEELGGQTVVNDQLGGIDVVVAFDSASQMALPFARQVDDQILTFERREGAFPFQLRDLETGSTWTILGRAVDGPLAGTQLTQVPAHNAFWFAWVTFWPETDVFQP